MEAGGQRTLKPYSGGVKVEKKTLWLSQDHINQSVHAF